MLSIVGRWGGVGRDGGGMGEGWGRDEGDGGGMGEMGEGWGGMGWRLLHP